MCDHTSFRDNGGKARRFLLRRIPFSPPSAVHSTESFLPPLHHRRLAVRPLSAYSSASSVSSISAWRKFNALKHVLSRPVVRIRHLPQKEQCFFKEDHKKSGQVFACPDKKLEINADTRTPSHRGTRYRHPECPCPPTAGTGLRHATACRTTCGSRSRRS